jgi:hypothetical protein
MMPPDYELALRNRVALQAEPEQSGNVAALCGLILPAYRATAEKLAQSTSSFEAFVKRVQSVQLLSFELEWWNPAVARFGGSAAALVRTTVRYNMSAEPAHFRTIWVRVDGQWYTTATGKF